MLGQSLSQLLLTHSVYTDDIVYTVNSNYSFNNLIKYKILKINLYLVLSTTHYINLF